MQLGFKRQNRFIPFSPLYRAAVGNYACFGCGMCFTRRRALVKHQGKFWPSCPNSIV